MANEDKQEKGQEPEKNPAGGQEPESKEPKAEEQNTDEEGGSEADEGVKDSHGQPGINKERHDKEVAALNKKIEELQSQIDDAAKTEKARDDLKREIQKARDDIKEEKLNWQLEKAGCKNLKAAKVLLDDYDGDISKLKADCPYLFEEEKPSGSTGGKPSGPADDKEERLERARKAARGEIMGKE